MSDGNLDAASRVVRVFPGYAGTVLWAWFGTVEYDESGLSIDLLSALRAWETIGEREVATGVALSKTAAREWAAEGVRLANALAVELGSGFSVEVSRGAESVLVTSELPPANPAAAEVFESRRTVAVAEHLRWEAERAAMSPDERAFLRYEPVSGESRSSGPPDGSPPGAYPDRMANWDDVRGIALALPGVEETLSRGLTVWKAGRMFAGERPLRVKEVAEVGPVDEPILLVRVESEAEKFALIAEDPALFFTVSHFDGYPMVLVRLDRVDRARLVELVESAWATVAPAPDVRRRFGDG